MTSSIIDPFEVKINMLPIAGTAIQNISYFVQHQIFFSQLKNMPWSVLENLVNSGIIYNRCDSARMLEVSDSFN